MPLVYLSVSYKRTILAEYCIFSQKSMPNLSREFLKEVSLDKDKDYLYGDSLRISLINRDSISYLGIATKDTRAAIIHKALNSLHDNIFNYVPYHSLLNALPTQFNMQLHGVFTEIISDANNKNGDRTSLLKTEIKETEDTIQQGIEILIHRGEDLNDLVRNTELLQDDAGIFRKKAVKLKNLYRKRNIFIVLLILIIIVIITIIILLVACPHFRCKK